MSQALAVPKDTDPHLQSAVKKATRRLVPFLLLMYVIAFIDRVNIGFAKQELADYAGINAAAYAFGASVFFVSYVILEIPSNIIMSKVGARVWMCRIMATWGLASAATMFVQGPTSLYIIRFILGAFEAGFFPAAILFLTYWFPNKNRAAVTGLFYFGAPLAFVFGGPLSGLLLGMDGFLGLHGWQWMFLIEGLVATAVGIWAYFYLTDRPLAATWLTTEEKTALAAKVASENTHKIGHGSKQVFASLKDKTILYFSLIFFLIQMGVAIILFYLPTQIAELLGTKVGLKVGLFVAVPWSCAILAVFFIPRIAGRRNKLQLAGGLCLVVSAIGLVGSLAPSAGLAVTALCLAVAGIWAAQPIFWTLLTDKVAGMTAVAGIAMVNCLANVGNFFSPNIKAWLDARTGSETVSVLFFACLVLIAAGLFIAIRKGQPVQQGQDDVVEISATT